MDDVTVKRWVVGVAVPAGNGQQQKATAEVECTERDAHAALWDLLEGLGVESYVDEVEDV